MQQPMTDIIHMAQPMHVVRENLSIRERELLERLDFKVLTDPHQLECNHLRCHVEVNQHQLLCLLIDLACTREQSSRYRAQALDRSDEA